MAAPPETGDVAVHQEHGKEREEPKPVNLFAMFQRLPHGASANEGDGIRVRSALPRLGAVHAFDTPCCAETFPRCSVYLMTLAFGSVPHTFHAVSALGYWFWRLAGAEI